MVQPAPAGPLEARRYAEGCDDAGRLALARAFCSRVVASWWATLVAGDGAATAPATTLREPSAPLVSRGLDRAAKALAHGIGASLAGLDAETAAYRVGLTYTGMLAPAYRSAHGVFYTPPPLGARLIERATFAGVDWRTARILDPACGGGAFLAPVARRIIRALGDCDARIALRNVAERLRGYEIDPFAAWLSQVALDAALLPLVRACGRRLPELITVCDSLRDAPPGEPFDLVIGNPPYGRLRLDAAERRRFERSLFGHANLYGLFTDAAITHAKPGGVIAYVTPSSFLAGEYSKKLRALLGREAPPCSIDFVAAREGVFEGVLQETLLATYRRGGSPGPIALHEIAADDGDDLGVYAAGDAMLPADPSHPWILPRRSAQRTLVASLAAMPHRLADWGYAVSTGPLVWNRYKAQLAKRPGRARYPIVWAESVSSDGAFAWCAERRDHVPYFEIRAGDEWMTVRAACVLLQRTTSKEQNRRLIAALLPADFVKRHGAVVVENHLNMIRPVVARPAVAHGALAAFLNSGAADRAFRCVGGSVAVSAYELESLPLPPPGELRALSRLVARRAGRAAIEAECARLYGEPVTFR